MHLLGKGGANLGCGVEVMAREVVAMRRALERFARRFRRIDFQQLKGRSVGSDEGIVSLGEQSASRLIVDS